MFVRRGPLRHARMLVAVTAAAQERDALVIEPAADERGAEVVLLDLVAGPPLPDDPRDSVA